MKRSDLPYFSVVDAPDGTVRHLSEDGGFAGTGNHVFLLGGRASATLLYGRIASRDDLVTGEKGTPHLVITLPLRLFETIDWSDLEAIVAADMSAGGAGR
ncbi:Uncharacterised protein [Starkeya nomas]|uniref:Uncharacterized protein n=1 Tax=Starkeya nomas TaxID=2666134 RepID=A0A5S9R688_9HYPH|nr:hypothetical protein [Starkeya nomas]CAA0129480.1 Uncharacterised protein [Starkeya nomas]